MFAQDVENWNPHTFASENLKWCGHHVKLSCVSSQSEIGLPYTSAVSLLGICQKELETATHSSQRVETTQTFISK